MVRAVGSDASGALISQTAVCVSRETFFTHLRAVGPSTAAHLASHSGRAVGASGMARDGILAGRALGAPGMAKDRTRITCVMRDSGERSRERRRTRLLRLIAHTRVMRDRARQRPRCEATESRRSPLLRRPRAGAEAAGGESWTRMFHVKRAASEEGASAGGRASGSRTIRSTESVPESERRTACASLALRVGLHRAADEQLARACAQRASD